MMRIFHQMHLSTIVINSPQFIISATDNQTAKRFLFYNENTFFSHRDNIDLLDTMTPVNIYISKDNSIAYSFDSFCCVFFAT